LRSRFRDFKRNIDPNDRDDAWRIVFIGFLGRSDDCNCGTRIPFTASWDGTPIFSIFGINAAGYTHEIFSNLIASSSSTSLVFSGTTVTVDYLLDDVNVVSNSTVPEPSTPVTFLAALGILVLAHRLRRRETGRQLAL
jgi:hypothetical protein